MDLARFTISLFEGGVYQSFNDQNGVISPREKDVVMLFFGIGKKHGLTLEEIGSKFDLTRERVRQIKEKAIRRLRHNSRSKLLKAYLG